MRVRQQIREEPTAAVAANIGVRVRHEDTGVTLTTLTSDDDGYVTYQTSGHPPPFYFETTQSAGGPRFWRSSEAPTVGALSLAEVPIILSALGDGVLPDDGGFDLTISGTTLTLQPGVALVHGYPVVIYDAQNLTVTRPTSGTRIDRVVARVAPWGAAVEPGYADVALVAGEVGGSAPALVQTADEWQVGLWTVTIPAAGTITLTDTREEMLTGYLTPAATISGSARTSFVATDSGAGAALSGLSVTLDLPASTTYDIEAELTGTHTFTAAEAPTEGLAFESQFGSFGTGNGQMKSPEQVAIGSGGNLVVCDVGNTRIQTFTSAGVYSSKFAPYLSWPPVSATADSSGNIYAVVPTYSTVFVHDYPSGYYVTEYAQYLIKFDSAGTQAWIVTLSAVNTDGQVATDGTHVYVVLRSENKVYKRLCSTGAAVTTWTATSSGSPYGIATNGTSVWVSNRTGNTIREFTTTGTTVSTFGSTGSGDGQLSGPRGLAWDATNTLLVVADTGNHRVQRFASGVFADAVGTFGSGEGNLSSPRGVGIDADGEVLVADTGNHRIVRFAASGGGGGSSPGGYGTVAVEIDGNLSSYLGIGEMTGQVSNVHTRTKAGPASVVVRAYGLATSETLTLTGATLVASARPRG